MVVEHRNIATPKEAPSSFRHLIAEAIKRAQDSHSALLFPIDLLMQVLVIPPTAPYSYSETTLLIEEVKQNLSIYQATKKHCFSVDFPAIGAASYPLPVQLPIWYTEQVHYLGENIRLIFFIHETKFRATARKLFCQFGYTVKHDKDKDILEVEHLDLSIHINLKDLAIDALLQGYLLEQYLRQYAQQLIHQFKIQADILECLEKRFKHTRFWKEDGNIYAKHQNKRYQIDYHTLSQTIHQHGLSPQNIVKHMTLEDFDEYPLKVNLMLRSEQFTQAWPLSLKSPSSLGPWQIATWDNQHFRPISSVPTTPHRFALFSQLASIRIHEHHYDIRAVFQEQIEHFCLALIGNKITSIALYPHLLKGVLAALKIDASEIFVFAQSEDVLLLCDPKTPELLYTRLHKRALDLLSFFIHDGSDKLEVKSHISLPSIGCGSFNIRTIPSVFFDLIETSHDPALNLPIGRREYLKGLAFEIIREWNLAIQSFQVAYRADVNDPDISHALGRALHEAGNSKEAIIFLKRSLLNYPDDPEVLNTLGKCYLASGYPQEAQVALLRAIELVPDDAYYLITLSKCYIALHCSAEAARHLQQAVASMPDSAEGHSLLAQLYWKEGKLPLAKEHAKKAFITDPFNKNIQELLWALNIDGAD